MHSKDKTECSKRIADLMNKVKNPSFLDEHAVTLTLASEYPSFSIKDSWDTNLLKALWFAAFVAHDAE